MKKSTEKGDVMIGEKFQLTQYSISAILGLIDAQQFVIPEIQRPFVWKRTQVRDLIDRVRIMGIRRDISLRGRIRMLGQKMALLQMERMF